MNYKFIKFFMLVFGVFYAYPQQKLYIKDKETLQPIANALVIYNNNFKETDENGKVELNILSSKCYVEVSRLGYVPFKNYFMFDKNNILYLKSNNILDETIVHAHKNLIEKTSVGTMIKTKALQQSSSVNIGEVLTKVEGVSTIKTGGTIVKPVIHGMYGNRIVILNNGVVQQGQDWSAEHATEIDPFIADKINVVKGAEGVKYGSGALGGVVLISPKKLPYHIEKLQGNIIGILASNGNGTTTSAKIENSLFDNRFAWRIQGTKHISRDVKTAKYYLNNTGTNSLSFSINMGFKSHLFGLETFYSQYKNTYGLTYISEVGNNDDLINRYKIGRPLQVFDPTYSVKPPKQEVLHNLLKTNGFWKFSENGKLKFQYSFQFNDRKEYFPRRGNLSEIPAFHTGLSTHNLSVNFQQKWNSVWKTEIGGNYQNQINENISGTKIDPTIPNFTNISFGGYVIQKYKHNPLELTAGIRYDYKTENVAGIRRSKRYHSGRTFNNVVCSLSGTYKWENVSFTSNFGVASRSPHVSELHSYGLKHGGLSFLVGDKNLKSENGLKWINNIAYEKGKLSVNFSGFVQKINNYIYEQPTFEEVNLWGGLYTKSYYKQANAFFRGFDLNFCFRFDENFNYLAKGALIYATNLDTNGYFPFMPSENFEQEIRFNKTFENQVFNEVYAGFTHRFVAKQHRIDKTSDLIVDSPKSYHLFNISAGFTSTKFKNKQVSFHISVDNLFDNLYKEYTNRYRYFAHDLGKNFQVKTIFNF